MVNGRDTFVIEIESDKVLQLMQVFGGSYQQLAQNLKLMNDRMVLVNPYF